MKALISIYQTGHAPAKRMATCIFLFLIFSSARLQAQNAIFLTEGKIEFEKKVNMYALMEEGDSWNDLQKKTMPKFKSTYFDLLFTKNRTIYQPGRENPDLLPAINFV